MHGILRSRAIALILVLSVGVAACDFAGVNEAIDGFKVIIGLEEISTPVSVKFVDAQTGELVTSPVELSFGGRDGDAVVDLFNDPITSGKSTFKGGVGTFGIANDLAPSREQPVSIRVTARAAGYEPQVRTIQLEQEGRQSVIVRLAASDSPLEGAATARVQSGTADASGAITQPIQVSTESTGTTPGAAMLRIPAGTVARSADGRALSGSLTTRIRYASTTSRKAMATFPGGFHADVAGESGGALTTVGFADITVSDASGRSAKTFTDPIEIGFDIAPGTINPNTGAPVSEGDELDVFSFDVEDGMWQREGKVTVQTVDGRPQARFSANHLSTWSLGTMLSMCDATFSLTTNGNTVTSISVWNEFYSNTFSIPAGMQQLDAFEISLLVPGGVTFEYEIRGTTVYTGSIANACDGGSITLPPPAQTAKVVIESSVEPCPAGKSLKAGYEGDYGIEVAEVLGGAADWESAQTVSVSVVTEGNVLRGTAPVTVRAGSEYRVQGSFNEEIITGSFTVPGDVVDGAVLPAEIDNEITNEIAADACE